MKFSLYLLSFANVTKNLIDTKVRTLPFFHSLFCCDGNADGPILLSSFHFVFKVTRQTTDLQNSPR